MKKFFVFALLLFISCSSNENKIEVVRDYDSIYLAESYVDTPAKEKEKNYSEKMKKDLINLFKKHYDKNLNKPVAFKIALRFYINENGKIDKIKVLDAQSYNLNMDEKNAAEFKNYESIYAELPEILNQYSFIPAVKNGKPAKYRNDIAFGSVIFPNGKIINSIAQGFAFDNTSFDEKSYLVAVTEQPEPIGGMYEIQRQIVYPEIAKRAGIQGRVFVKAFLNENGEVVKVDLLKGIGGGCDEQAVNAVKNTKFKPGVLNGKKVKTQVAVPIMFKLN